MAHTEAHIEFDTLSTATTVGTGNATDGTGNFDNLMKVVTLHLEDQFTAGRITGTDYATVYLGALQSTLDQAVNFTLSMNKANADVDLVGKQEELVAQQKLTEVQSTSLVTNKVATELKQALDIAGATSLKSKQALTEEKKALDLVSNTSVRNTQSTQDSLVKGAQVTKLGAEEDLLDQKEITEFAQTGVSTITAPTTGSVTGKQITLFTEQAKGFKWNADAKYLKTVLDAYAVNLSVSKTYDGTTKPAIGGHVTNSGTLDQTSKAGDYVVKLKPT
jgi:hypothetical protein